VNTPFHRHYGTLQGIEDGLYQASIDRTRYTPDESLYNKKVDRSFSKLFESQFFEKIKTPEQTKVVQQTVSKEGR
jgi:hypothetical protein